MSSPDTPGSAKKKRKPNSPVLPKREEIIEQSGIVLQTLATAVDHHTMLLNQDYKPPLKTIKPLREDSYEIRGLSNFRKEIAKRCYMAQECCTSLSQAHDFLMYKIKQVQTFTFILI
jgi:hypothetical protein